MNHTNNLKLNVARHRLFKNSKNQLKKVKAYIKNGAVISNKKAITYPDAKIDLDFRFRIKNVPAKLTQNNFYLLKQASKSKFTRRGQPIQLPGSTLNVKQKRPYNFYQKNYKNFSNLKTFYSLRNKTVKKSKSYTKG
jgi:hypothetical protein